MNRLITTLLLATISYAAVMASPLHGLMERLSPGLSQKIEVRIEHTDSADWYELEQSERKPLIRANSYLSAASALFQYLTEYCYVRPGWMQPTVTLPDTLPAVTTPVTRRCTAPLRYYLNYCTYSYSTAFWDWKRWQQEIDWMALHGINMPLAIEGTAAVWRNTLRRLGYPEESIAQFVAGPAYQAWWLMNNLEGWGGPVPDAYYERSAALQQRILAEMRAWGMEPVLPGYSGMMPHDASDALGIATVPGGHWAGFIRPSIILPTSPDFARVAQIYYQEQAALYGRARYYSMDPFHEGGSTEGVDLRACGQAIYTAMQSHSPGSIWLLQGWQENPRSPLLASLPADGALLLDLQAESEPMWRKRTDIFRRHPWIYCMLLNFGGNEGLHGKADALIDGYEHALAQSSTLTGIGLTMEAISNNPVMYDLLTALPWLSRPIDTDSLLRSYVRSAYGCTPDSTLQAWRILMRSVYNSPADSIQQGTTESIFCARPSDHPHQASAWANTKDYYAPGDVITAARLLLHDGEQLDNRVTYRYDAVNTARQAVAECGRIMLARIDSARITADTAQYRDASQRFLQLIDIQDSITAMHPAMRLSSWLTDATASAPAPPDTALWQRNALLLITTWGPRQAAENGNLRDYSHREWSGLLGSLYRRRWAEWFDARVADLQGVPPQIDFYTTESDWVANPYITSPDTQYSTERLRRLLHRAIGLTEGAH